MDFANAVIELWARKIALLVAALIAVAIGLSIAYHVQINPPALKAKSFQVGVAETTVLVDLDISAIETLPSREEADPFVTQALQRRAQSLAQLMGQGAIRDRIAKRLGISPGNLAVTLPVDPARPGQTRQEPDSGARASEIVAAANAYSLTVEDSTLTPTIRLIAQAPTAERAIDFADASARALGSFVNEIQDQASLERRRLRRELRQARDQLAGTVGERPRQRIRNRIQRLEDDAGSIGLTGRSAITVRRLSAPSGGTVSQGTNVQLAIAAAVVAFVLLAILILVASGAARGIRAASAGRRAPAPEPEPEHRPTAPLPRLEEPQGPPAASRAEEEPVPSISVRPKR